MAELRRAVAIAVLGLASAAAASGATAAASPAAIAADSLPPAVLTIAAFRASPPVGRAARIVGYVVESYRCPPCPPRARCKPCAISSTIFVGETPDHAPFALSDPPADVISVSTDDPDKFQHGMEYRFEISVVDRSQDQFDGRLLRSQRPDVEPIWTDSP
jgi:hypothetical protein